MAKTFTAHTISNNGNRYHEAKFIEELSGKCLMRVHVWDWSTGESKEIGIFYIPATRAGRAKYEHLEAAINGDPIF